MGALIVLTTVGTEEEANRIAGEMVARRHAACVNLVPVHRSVYRWQGKICDDREYLLLIKTEEGEYSAVEAAIQELHDYDLPEILAFKVHRGEAAFLEWITASLDKSAAFDDGDDDETDSAPPAASVE